jgi:hypothetical protein
MVLKPRKSSLVYIMLRWFKSRKYRPTEYYSIPFNNPPSALIAAPLVAEAKGLTR